MTKKRIVALFVCMAMSIVSVMPAFAADCCPLIAGAMAVAEQRKADFNAYQQALKDFQASEIAKGVQANAEGLAAYEAGQAALKNYWAGELAKGAAGASSLQAFWNSQLAAGDAQRAAGQAAYDAYQAAMKAREEGILAEAASIASDRAAMQNCVDQYLASLW